MKVLTVHLITSISNIKNITEVFKTFEEWEFIHNFTIKNTQLKLVLTHIIRTVNVQFAVGLLLTTASVLIDSYYFNENNLILMLEQTHIFKSMQNVVLYKNIV